jgi:hypothetical protein
MTDKRWVSTTGDLNAAASYSPSGVPVDLDSLHLDGSSNIDVLSNLTALSAGGMSLTRVWLQSPYQGDFGADGNVFYASVKHLIHNGTGSLYHHALSPLTSSYFVIDSPNQQDAYTLVDTDGAAGVTMTLACISGGVRIAERVGATGIVLRELLIGGRGGSSAPIVAIESFNSIITYRQSGGYVNTRKGLGSDFGGTAGRAILDGGTLVYDALGTSGWNKMEITGGRMEYNGTGTMASCIVSSGTLDMTKNSRAKVITSLILLPGATFLTHKNITFGSPGLIDLRDSYPILP